MCASGDVTESKSSDPQPEAVVVVESIAESAMASNSPHPPPGSPSQVLFVPETAPDKCVELVCVASCTSYWCSIISAPYLLMYHSEVADVPVVLTIGVILWTKIALQTLKQRLNLLCSTTTSNRTRTSCMM